MALTTFLIAIIPSIILGLFIYEKDILEKEPLHLLIKLFLFGVVITIPASFIENIVEYLLNDITNINLKTFLVSFIEIALVEEGFKFLITYESTWNNRNFNHIYDGIVYSVFTSLGFATLENILYVYAYGNSVGILRALVSVPGHVFFGVAMGYYLGFSKFYEKNNFKEKEKKYKSLSFFVPIVLHGTFDFLLLTNNELMIIIFIIFVLFLYVVSYKKVKRLSDVKDLIIKDEVYGSERNF